MTVFPVAQTLLKQGHMTYKGERMVVTEYTPSHDNSAQSVNESAVVVVVSGIPKNVTQETLVMYLENKRRSGGGQVKTIEYNSASGTAIVTFQDDSG